MKTRTAYLLAGLIALGAIQRTLADGTEGLGIPSIPIASGTGIAAGGRGLITQPGVITVTVPAGATIKQVLLYWEGFMLSDTVGDNTIRVSNGGPPVTVNGTLIGGPSFFFFFAWASTFRADITSLGLVTAGVNNLTVDQLSFTEANNGAGVLVIYDDGSPPKQINVRDGNDLAFINFPEPRLNTIPQTFNFAPSVTDRVARFDMFAASVSGVTSTGGPQRPNVVEITVGGVTTTYNNLLDSFAGEEWDYLSLPVDVPAGITSVKVQIFSRDDLGLDETPASLDWLAAFFVIEVPAHIGDLVFRDLNANGIQDGGAEVGVDGVTVELFTCGGNVLTGTTVTAGGGLYGFDVIPGDYYLKFSNLPAGFIFSPSTASGASDPVDSDANPLTGITDCTTIISGENDPTWDAGIFQQPQGARIGDLVFNDLNANGIQDGGGEVGVDGVTVQLYACVGDVLTGTTVTAGGGLYLFTVPPGDYYVKFSNLPVGFTFSPSTPSAASDPTDSDANPATGVANCTTLVAGETDLTWDAGIYQPAKIGDLVFNDLNANGIQDGGGEVGVNGVTVELYACAGDVLMSTTVTAGGGLYLFTVPPGDYYVKFSNLPAGFTFSPSTPSAASDPTDSDANPATGVANCTTLVAAETDLTWDAGIYQPARIGDLVFNDLNANGLQDGGGEVGVNGVTVELYNCLGDVLVATTVTAGGGLYLFTVPPGNYYVKFSNLPAGFVFSPSTPNAASDPNDSDANPATGVANCTTLIAGESDLTWDAGIYQPAKIGDLVFNDLNANGNQDGGGEVGVNGVMVQLYNCVGDVLVATTVTTGGGLYLFTVPPGDYYVKFSNLPAGFVFSPSTPNAASDPNDSDANPATGVANCTTLVAGETDLTWDAGIYQSAQIGDLVFNDLNGNGNQDGGGEVGVNGVTVELYNCVGDVLVATTVTAGGGLYQFTVTPGDYYVKFSNLPAGFVFSPSTPSAASDPTDSDANPTTGVANCTTIVAGETDLTWDAGIYQPAKIGDLVFNDLNANGNQDGGGEVGVNGVTVQLYNCVGDVLVATTVTAGGGLYLFTVPPGDYYVKFSNLPAGFVFSPSTPNAASDPNDSDANPATGVANCTTLAAGETDLTWDAGIYQPAKIGDLVFNDLNGNGNQDGGGEVGVNGVMVQLYNCVGDVLVATTMTAGGGLYQFTVPPGDYYVKFSNLPAGFVFSPSTPNAASDPNDSDADPATGVANCTTLAAGETDLTWDAGIYQPAKIGDLVFNDLNGNGNQDAGGEVGVNGVTVQLYNCVGDVLVATTVTAGGGLYQFTVPPGDYYVKFSNLPAGFVFSPSTPNAASDPNDSDADPATGVANCTTLAAGETDLTWDAGIYQPARIGDLVFNDLNGNGNQDGGGEVGVNGVTVQLYNCVGDVLVATTVTAGGGLYQFTVPPGDYYVKFSNLPAGFVFSPSTPSAASDPNDSDANPATGVANCTTLAAGETDLTWDAGIYQPATIGDLVFNDLNANGTQDGGGEVGVNGVMVQLYNCVGDVLVATTVTAGGGLYQFTVPPGDYYVKFSNLPAGFVFSPSTPSAASDPTDSDANPVTGVANCTTLAAGEIDLTWDAGIYQPAKIGDLVFNDLNGNGNQDGGGEVGVNGVTVQLYNCVGDVLVATTITAGGGLYQFTVPPGDYYVKFSNLPAGFVFSPSTPNAASDPNDSDANPATGVANCTTLAAGETDLTWDAGIYQPAKIGDLVFNDLNANGTQDGGGEVGVNGVTVQLFTCVGDVLMGTTVTAGGGLYLFTVAPGDYYVKFSNLPAGFIFSPSTPSGASDPADSDANPATGATDCTTLVAGEVDLDWDAGIYQPPQTATIGDFVFNDINANGIQNGGEVGVNGVTVELFTCVGNVLMGTTVTAGGGLYLFTVPPGDYYVKFSNLPAGFIFSPSTASAASDPNDSDANPATGATTCTALVGGENDLTWDAGIYQLSCIGDLVFYDLNGNGLQDGGLEVGVGGVTVQLYNCLNDALVSTTVTPGTGLYSFCVPPGSYYVKFSNLPAGYVFSPSTPGDASDPTDSDANPITGKTDCTDLGPGETDTTWDAGIYQPAKIGDLVFNDLNNNGNQDGGGEVGVNGVTVQLYNCVGDVVVATTVTAGGGLYQFTVPPGNYYVKFSNLPAGFAFSPSTPGGASDPTDSDANPTTGKTDCTTLTSGEIDLTWDAGINQPSQQPCLELVKVADKSFVSPGASVTYTYTVKNCGTTTLTDVSVKDDNGTPGYLADDFIVGTIASLAPGAEMTFTKTLLPPLAMCMTVNGTKMVVGTLTTETLGNGDIKVVYLQSRNVNDNTYGTGVIGWPGNNHKFMHLTGSDRAEFAFYNTGGTKVMHIEVDYLSAASTAVYPSGYGTAGVTGNDGSVILGSATDVVSTMTTLTRAINNSPFIYTANSPLPEGSVPTWEYINGYEVVVKGSIFGASGFGRVEIPSIHNSPSKLGFNVTTPEPCDSCITNIAVVTAKSGGTVLTASDDARVCISDQPPQAAIGDFVWDDKNNNGRQDAGEPGVSGVKVELFTCVGNALVGTTTTSAGGLYGFNVNPGNYYVKFSNLPAGYSFSPKNAAGTTAANDSDADPATGLTICTTLTAGENDITWDAGIFAPVNPDQCLTLTKTASKTTLALFEPVTYSYTVCNCGSSPLSNVVITDDNGTPGNPIDDFTVGSIPTLGATACQTLTAQVIPVISTVMTSKNGNVPAGALIVVTTLPNGDIKVTYLQDFGVNDNTYGTGSIGWSGSGHKFNDLVGSDKLEFRFFAKNGTVPLDFYIDTISAVTSVMIPGTGQVINYPSGYGTYGPFGGDGSMVAGNANNIVTFSTAISDNLNRPANLPNKAALIVNSPTSLVGGNVVVDPVKAPGGWNHINSFTAVVKGSTFAAGGGFDKVTVPDQHNSPSKGPKGDITFTNSVVTNTATATAGSLTATAKAVVAINTQQASPASIGDFVWDDLNKNGRQDAGEPGVNGVKVELFACAGNTLVGTTTTSNGGLYGFNVNPGDYYVKFSNLPAGYSFTPKNAVSTTSANDSDADPASGQTVCTTLVTGENDNTWDAGIFAPVGPTPCLTLTKTASKDTVAPYEPVTYTYVVCNCSSGSPLSNVVVTDDNGTPNASTDDFIVGTIASLAPGACSTLTAQVIPVVSTVTTVDGVVTPSGAIIVVTSLPNGNIKITYLQDFGINDNTYGTGSIGWADKGHKFQDLTGSDKLEFRLFAKDGTVPLDFYLDCITAASSVTIPGTGQVITFPSGYGSLGPFGGDGSMVAGDRNNIVSFTTSIADNLNNPANLPNKAALIVNSPTSLVGNNVVVDTTKAPGGWEYINSYSVIVKGSTFAAGGGFGAVSVPDQHNSPAKRKGTAPTVVNSSVTNTATATAGGLTATGRAVVSIVAQSTPGGGSLPSPWQTADIGAVGAAGSASFAGTTFTVAGSGKEINGPKDKFRYVYQQANGDCTIVAKVLSVTKANDESAAGVMIRETLNDNSKHASLLVTADKGLHFKSRSTTGGPTSKMTVNGAAPYWVRVVRSGNTFTASRSTDGVTWTSMGSVSISMGSSVYIGLGVTSHKDNALSTAKFDNVTVTP